MTKKYVYNYPLQNKNGTILPISLPRWGIENLPFHEISGFLKSCNANFPNIAANKIRIEYFLDDNNNESGGYVYVDDDVELIDFPSKYYEMIAADPSITKHYEFTLLGDI